MQRVDSFEDLIEYLESLLLVEFVRFAVFAEVELVGSGYETCHLVVGDLLLYFQEVLWKQVLLYLSHKGSVELEALGDAQLVNPVQSEEFDVQKGSLFVVGLSHLHILRAQLLDFLAGDA